MRNPRFWLVVIGLAVVASFGVSLSGTTEAQLSQERLQLEWEYKVVDVLTPFQNVKSNEDPAALLRRLENLLKV